MTRNIRREYEELKKNQEIRNKKKLRNFKDGKCASIKPPTGIHADLEKALDLLKELLLDRLS